VIVRQVTATCLWQDDIVLYIYITGSFCKIWSYYQYTQQLPLVISGVGRWQNLWYTLCSARYLSICYCL